MRNCSNETSSRIDEMTIQIVRQQHEKARGILRKREKALHALAQHLYEKETITGEEFMQILSGFETPPEDAKAEAGA